MAEDFGTGQELERIAFFANEVSFALMGSLSYTWAQRGEQL